MFSNTEQSKTLKLKKKQLKIFFYYFDTAMIVENQHLNVIHNSIDSLTLQIFIPCIYNAFTKHFKINIYISKRKYNYHIIFKTL